MSTSNTNNSEMVIAIDYDGTITDDTPFPKLATIRPEALLYIPLLYNKGYKLILWTARKEEYYAQAVERLKEIGLYKYFDFQYGDYGVTGKLVADFYIDDRSSMGPLDWNKIYKYIVKELHNEQRYTK